jgi:hypothetical protein
LNTPLFTKELAPKGIFFQFFKKNCLSYKGVAERLHKLKAANIINEFESKNIEALGDIRNKAAHGGEFPYSPDDVKTMQERVSDVLSRLMSGS